MGYHKLKLQFKGCVTIDIENFFKKNSKMPSAYMHMPHGKLHSSNKKLLTFQKDFIVK